MNASSIFDAVFSVEIRRRILRTLSFGVRCGFEESLGTIFYGIFWNSIFLALPPAFAGTAVGNLGIVFQASRSESTILRIRSETVIPSSFARFCNHLIWGSVKTTDILVLFISTYLAPSYSVVKGLVHVS